MGEFETLLLSPSQENSIVGRPKIFGPSQYTSHWLAILPIDAIFEWVNNINNYLAYYKHQIGATNDSAMGSNL